MIATIIQLLQLNDYYGVSETIDIAKGKYELPKSLKQGIKQIKRDLKWQKQKQ